MWLKNIEPTNIDSTLLLNPSLLEMMINPIANEALETSPMAVSPSINLLRINILIKIAASTANGKAK